ncbi:MAG: tRNA (adenosine(37)-N6)-dimethylallyltransferase MiaA [Bacteroidetes bacterium]|nr:tRNA (adenosine(37)-N6)-dimethylallyltransferase MiaA [Bacteroidota bacterium]
MKKTLVVLAGPTAVGKTSCGLEVARHFGTEIISADSRQIYKETTIGTAVPSPEELAMVKHHFIQNISVTESYNASMYENQVLEKLEELFKIHDLVLMVGGSGLYIDAVCEGIDDLPKVDQTLREELQDRLKKEGLDVLTQLLLRLDPVSYEKVDLKNHMRVLKALEISIQTGKPYSTFLSDTKKERPFQILRIALDLDREILYTRINRRVEQMMEAGLLEEVKQVQHLKEYTAMKTVGYRELFRVLDEELSIYEGVDLIKRNTRKFARKQLTWLRKEKRYQWFSPGNCKEILDWIETESGYL